ncbi:hypothetical protein bAD24_p00800 (plasmid) [Burkholderia sp. AD24]|nr:hypothetical protein bAD24_p00800 [Burkholderia sp. AD24]
MKKLFLVFTLASGTMGAMAAETVGAFGDAYRGGKVLSVSTSRSADKEIESVQLVKWQRRDGRVCRQTVRGVAVMQTPQGDQTAFVTTTRCGDK